MGQGNDGAWGRDPGLFASRARVLFQWAPLANVGQRFPERNPPRFVWLNYDHAYLIPGLNNDLENASDIYGGMVEGEECYFVGRRGGRYRP